MEITMKMIIVLLMMASNLAIAGDGNTAYNMICRNLTYELDRNKCVETIRPHSYFDDQALGICSGFKFDSYKIQCLGNIAGKQYNGYEINACINTTFDFDKLTCLRVNGTVIDSGGNRPCIPRRLVLEQLQTGLNNLRNGELGTLDKRLQYLISNFSNPNCQ